MTTRHDVVIVGAGHAGAQTAIALRQHKFAGSIALIGAEPELPYERPPLSKEYLSGEKSFDRLLIRQPGFWEERGIVTLLGRRIVSVDPQAHEVRSRNGERHGYGTLVWAAGGSPRRLSCNGADLDGVHSVRSRADVDGMRAELAGATRIVVVGGGYVGLEAAAVLAKLGKQVSVIEAQDRVLARVAGEPLSRFFEAEHRAHGVDIRLDAAVASLLGSNGAVSGVQLVDGEVLPADMVIVGIGITPEVEPLIAAGAAGGNGVLVDRQCRTSLPDVFAIGDCALHANRFAGGAAIRLESVQNANDQGMVVAKALTGQDAAYDSVPWFWSDQYDLKLQTVGLSAGYDDAIVRGDPAQRAFSIIYRKAGRVIALDCVNATRDYVQGRKLVTEGASPDRAALADASVPLKELLG